MKKRSDQLFNIRDVLAYFFVAATGAVVQILVAKFFHPYYGYDASLTIGYFVAFVVGFGLTKVFAFDAKQSQKTRREMVKYVVISSFAGGVMVAFAHLTLDLINEFWQNKPFLAILKDGNISDNPRELFSHITGMGFSFIVNYVGHKTITFKSTGFYDRIKANPTYGAIIEKLK